jgi:hypothetical protein
MLDEASNEPSFVEYNKTVSVDLPVPTSPFLDPMDFSNDWDRYRFSWQF